MLKSETFSLRDSSEVCACTQMRDDPIDKPNPAGSSLVPWSSGTTKGTTPSCRRNWDSGLARELIL